MGLDATIKRPDHQGMGTPEEIEAILAEAFPGLALNLSPTGEAKVKMAEQQGVSFPRVIRDNMLAQAAQMEGTFEGDGFSAEFYFCPSEPICEINAIFRGTTTLTEPNLKILAERFDWITTYP